MTRLSFVWPLDALCKFRGYRAAAGHFVFTACRKSIATEKHRASRARASDELYTSGLLVLIYEPSAAGVAAVMSRVLTTRA